VPLVNVFSYTFSDYIFMLFKGFEVFVSHLRRNLVSNMQELTKTTVVIFARLLVL